MIDLSRWPEADALIDELLALPPAERHPALASKSIPAELRAAVAAVVAEDQPEDGFLDPAALPARPVVADLRSSLDHEDLSLEPGRRFAQYEVVAVVGRGGMGEVYRARDPRLGRDIALKVLPDSLAEDPERLARFEREARMLAALNHPNVAAIYGFAESGTRHALVLEFVAGETLADRIARGPLKPADAIAVARQIALALDAAHQRGIVHRDLKPANIRITPDGTVKVLDFGLAKSVSALQASRAASAGLTSAWRPEGALLGTPAYMAPEQAQGSGIDHRVDVWAFGCILYEMLTGSRAFAADNASATIARVLEREPEIERLPAGTPEALRRLLRRTLVKDPARRLSSIGDVVHDLDEAEQETGRSPWFFRSGAVAGLAVAVLGLLIVLAWGWPMLRSRWTEPAGPVRLAVPISARETLLLSGQQAAALSPDGTTVVYRAARDGNVQLFSRALAGAESRPLAGTMNAAAPFFSPDGAWIGFDGDGVLQKVSFAGGSPVTLCKAPGGANASWGGDVIVFSTGTGRILQRVAAGGGVPERLTELDTERGEIAHDFPHVLPAGDAVLFTSVTRTARHIAALRFDAREPRLLLEGSQPRYLSPGYLLFIRNDALWAAPFDVRTLTITGEALPAVSGLDTAGGNAAHFAASESGTLLYVPHREEVLDRHLIWLDRRGRERPLPLVPKRYQRAALSPDGRRVAVSLSQDDNTDIWVGDVDQPTLIRVTREPSSDTAPLWSPDGQSIVFRSTRDGGGLFEVSATGGPARKLTSSPGTLHTAHGWTPDGQGLLFTEFISYTEQRFSVFDRTSGRIQRLLDGAFAQLRPQVSPDGRWLAYQSDESGHFEIYVRPFQRPESGVWRVSTAGGVTPRWTRNGRELVFHDGRGIVAVPVEERTDTFTAGTAQRLFDYSPYTGRLGPDYDVTADGERFLMIRSADDSPGSRAQLVVVQNWLAELRSQFAR